MIDSKSCMLITYKLPFQRHTSFPSASCSASALLAGRSPKLQCFFFTLEKSSSLLQSIKSAGLYKKEVVELRLFSTIIVLFYHKTQWEKDWSVKYLLWSFLSIVCCQNKMFLSVFFSFVLHGFRQGLSLILIKGKSPFIYRFVLALNQPLTAHICIFAMEVESLVRPLTQEK